MTEKVIEAVEVTQADRKTAAEIVRWQIGVGWEPQFFHPALPEGIEAGAWDDHDLVQFVARHRIAALTPPDGDEVERVTRSLLSACRDYPAEAKVHPSWQQAEFMARAALSSMGSREEEMRRALEKIIPVLEADREVLVYSCTAGGALSTMDEADALELEQIDDALNAARKALGRQS